MPFFNYQAVNAEGKKLKGTLESSHIDEASARLQNQGMTVISLAIAQKAASKMQLRSKELLNFIQQLASLLAVGLPLYESLCEIAKQHLQERYYPTLFGLCESIKEGGSLAQAMSDHPQSFSPLMIAMVEAGQASGSLDVTLADLAQILTKQQKIRKQLLTATLYPAILASFSIFLVLVLLLFVIPSLEMLFVDRSVNMLTRMVIFISQFLRKHYLILILSNALASVMGYRYLVSTKGKQMIEKLALKLPIIRTLLIQKDLGQFSYLMNVMLKGGVPLVKALQTSKESCKLQTFKTLFSQIEQTIVEGKLISEELKQVSYVPSLMVRLIAIGEQGGNLPEMFHNISQLYEAEVDKLLSQITALAQPVLLMIMGMIVGIIMLAILLPLTDVNAFI